jgi:hypothetical protein
MIDFHTLAELDAIQHDFMAGVGPSLNRIELFVVSPGQLTVSGCFIETVTRKPTAVYDWGFQYYVTYRGKKCRILEIPAAVCCGSSLVIEYPDGVL